MSSEPDDTPIPTGPQPKGPKDGATSIEDQIRFAYLSPPPTQYDINFKKSTTGGVISKSILPNTVEEQARLLKHVPGPDKYLGPGEFPLPDGGRYHPTTTEPKFNLDDLKFEPGPGQYSPHPLPKHQPLGTFTKEVKAPRYIDDEVKRTIDNPPVAFYETQRSNEFLDPFLPEGGRGVCNQSKSQSWFDDVADSKAFCPSPTKYANGGNIEPKIVGRPPFKLLSETMEETKKLVQKALGKSEIPGPGAYDLPDFPPGRSFVMQGRTLPHSMPAPYNYNSQPDLSRKFLPLRQQNSGDLIFGRSFRMDSYGPALRKSEDFKVKEESSVDPTPRQEYGESEISSTDMHKGWEEGGFTGALKRSRSEQGIPLALRRDGDEHVSVIKAGTYYHRLSGHLRKNTPTFLPMASRRVVGIETDSDSQTYRKYLVSKQSLKMLAQDLDQATKAVVGPLDKNKLLQETEWLLGEKARSRLRILGYTKDTQDEVIAQSSLKLKILLGMAPTPPVSQPFHLEDR